MTLAEFADLVRRMRKTQAEYFRRRTPQLLQESRDLERRCDEALREMASPQGPGLFDAPREGDG